MSQSTTCCLCCIVLVAGTLTSECLAQTADNTDAVDVLSEDQWQQVDSSVEEALKWLASQQQRDGSFPTLANGQPGVTSLCVMAFMAHGHLPGQGPYGEQLRRAIDYVVSCQKRNGILALVAPNGPSISRNVPYATGSTASYNHAIAGLVLSESYAIEGAKRAHTLRPIIRKALDVTLEMQRWPKDNVDDKGGWRYLNDFDHEDSDLSITGWQLIFLRSAKNAGFDVSNEPIDAAVAYVRRCFLPDSGTFAYAFSYKDYTSRAMAGAGILALAHSGLHDTPEAQSAGDWLLRNRFDDYNGNPESLERYHYGLLTCCQAMYQLGGPHWERFYPSTVTSIVSNQQPNGSWPRESHHRDASFGSAYTTAICLVALGAPNQLLPIFQR